MRTRRLTMGQALVQYLIHQDVERDGQRHPFFAGCFGIFGHGNVAGIGQALHQYPQFPYYQARNEQAMVHAAAAFAKVCNRLRTLACTTSIGPGATNMITAAAGATINRLPVLLLPGDVFARRNVAPVLQQLESPHGQDVSVNDCFRPVSRYWDRINRPDQLIYALPEAMRVLTSPAETGAVTLCLPQDVQAESHAYPEALFERRVWRIPRNRPDRGRLLEAAEAIRASSRPLIVAGGGVLYADASEALLRFVEQSGIPVAETQAGKGSLPYDHRLSLGAVGVTGTLAANRVAREADLVIGLGTRWSDFTTASKTAFQHPEARFVNVNVTEFDACKHAGIGLCGDARAILEELADALAGYHTATEYRAHAQRLHDEWDDEVSRVYALRHGPPLSQGEVIGLVNAAAGPRDVVLCAAGSLPGDLHKLWRTRAPNTYHLEYGYSCMGYEIAGGIGVKMAAPDREVFVMVGDGSYLMMNTEIVTAVQEGLKIIIVLLDNHGFSSIGGLSRAVGNDGFGTHYRFRNPRSGQLDGEVLPLDLAANARSLGARVIEARTHEEVREALAAALAETRTTVVVVPVDRESRVAGYESWWDVPVAEVSEMETVRAARARYEEALAQERHFV
ncbi:MAG: 3D-(3,5/4)-trihydroxycyclohexane-1,2-dione acylhydrolase (decyclizing) [Armatimonadetes bacterium]|nr:3D-(3,5/4)-trihydroxycyclohexane-1,2-dione acylhydrolase (decyclizing) [Armatimonadota bacterium]